MFFFCNQKTAYELRISDWSSDVCSSDLAPEGGIEIEFGIGEHRPAGERLAVLDLLGAPDACRGLKSRIVGEDIAEIDRVVAAIGFDQGRRLDDRSAERRVGKECVSTCRSRWPRDH